MKLYRRLHVREKKVSPRNLYHSVLNEIVGITRSGHNDQDRLFLSADLYAENYLSYNLRRKEANPFGVASSAKVRAGKTLTGFLVREAVNKKINETKTFGYDPYNGTFVRHVPYGEYPCDTPIGYNVLARAREIVHDIVGDCNLKSIAASSSFGNGASATMKRECSQRENKIVFGMSTTRSLFNLLPDLLEHTPLLAMYRDTQKEVVHINSDGKHTFPPGTLKIVPGAVFDTVPKDSKVDRVILKEPELNGFYQKGTGKVLREKLASYTRFAPNGMDLNRSGDLNSELAKAGSVDGHIATVDAERASDSLSLALYEFLFPQSWYDWFLTVRSPFCSIKNRQHRLHMMSGMGNGFTFEAESIIFYAIGLACSERSLLPFAHLYVSIHGDDLTLPSDVFFDCVEAYKAAGIIVNKEKSFSDGPFRESCGGHFFNGKSVKPFYVKTQTGNDLGDWCWLANSLLLWLSERSDEYLRQRKGRLLLEILAFLREYVTSESNWHLKVPYTFSRRSGLFSNAPDSTGRFWKVRMLVPRTDEEGNLDELGCYLTWLNTPVLTPTPLEWCLHKRHSSPRKSEDHEWAAELSVIERLRTVRNVNFWPALPPEVSRLFGLLKEMIK